MIKELIDNLNRNRAAYNNLIQKYPHSYIPDLYVNARNCIEVRTPYMAKQFFKTLNNLEAGEFYPESELAIEALIAFLIENEVRIEKALEMSKNNIERETLSGPRIF